MSATLAAAAPNAPPVSNVPMLDVSRENNQLRDEIDAAIADVCRSGAFVHGPACAKFEAAIAAYCGTEHAVGCASGSDALLLALMALGVGPGDEVIVPSFTFFATAGAVWRLGARPVFVDVDPATFNMSPGDLVGKISQQTKAIIPVHLFGQCAAMDEICRIATAARGIPIIEDACQAIGAEYRGRRAGSLGTCGALSFYPTKNLGGFGDGGMITTNDGRLAAKLRVLRDHGQQPRYYHHLVGLNSRLDTLQAAVLAVKLPYLDEWADARARNAARYEAEFQRRGLAAQIVTPKSATGCRSRLEPVHGARHQRPPRRAAKVPCRATDRFGDLLPGAAPPAKVLRGAGLLEGSLPATERAAREVLSLPIYPGLTESEQDAVIDAIGNFCQAKSRLSATTAA